MQRLTEKEWNELKRMYNKLPSDPKDGGHECYCNIKMPFLMTF